MFNSGQYVYLFFLENFTFVFLFDKIALFDESFFMYCEDFDLMIGITGLEGNLIIVTHNLKHFNRIKGIQTEDWAI